MENETNKEGGKHEKWSQRKEKRVRRTEKNTNKEGERPVVRRKGRKKKVKEERNQEEKGTTLKL